jgi:hypothetical protein
MIEMLEKTVLGDRFWSQSHSGDRTTGIESEMCTAKTEVSQVRSQRGPSEVPIG